MPEYRSFDLMFDFYCRLSNFKEEYHSGPVACPIQAGGISAEGKIDSSSANRFDKLSDGAADSE